MTGYPRETILKKKAQQTAKLNKMILDMLVAEEARKAGYDKSDDYQYLFALLQDNFYAAYLKKQLSDDVAFQEEIAKVSMIKLYVKDYRIDKNRRIKLNDTEIKKALDEKMVVARSIIGDLEKGKPFADLAKELSDDYSKKDGGDIGYISRDMKGPEFAAATFALNKGEYTKEPVVISNSIYIIKVDDKREVTNKNIEKVIGDKNKAQRMAKAIQRNKAKSVEDELLKAGDVEDHRDMVSSRNPATVLFKIGEEEYRVADLNRLIAYIEKKRKSSNQKSPIDDNVKKQMLQKIFNERLLTRETKKRGLDKEPDFQKSWDVFVTNSLAGAYKNDVMLEGVDVTARKSGKSTIKIRTACTRERKKSTARWLKA
jgi:hypothetical protein